MYWVWKPQGFTIEIVIYDGCCSKDVSSCVWIPHSVVLDRVGAPRWRGCLPMSAISWEFKVLSKVTSLLPAGVRTPCNPLSLIRGWITFCLIPSAQGTGLWGSLTCELPRFQMASLCGLRVFTLSGLEMPLLCKCRCQRLSFLPT